MLSFLFFARLPETPLERAIYLVKSNKAAAALTILEEIAQKQPENHEVLPWLALSYLSTDRLAEGRTALDTAIKVKLPCATVVPAIQEYSKYYAQKNDFAEADRLLSSARSLCPQTAIGPQRQAIYIAWSDADSAKGNMEDAVQHLEIALVTMDNDSQRHALSLKLADYYRQLALKAETIDLNDNRALLLLKKSLTASDEPTTRMALGNIYARQNEYRQAIEQFRGVADMDENNLESRHHLIDLYLTLGDIKGAQTVLSELADKERCLENYQLLAELNLKLNNYAGAVRSLEDSANLSPKDPEILTKLQSALLEWSAALSKQGKQDEALSTKGRAERISDLLKNLGVEGFDGDNTANIETGAQGISTPPFSLYASRTWLAKGSLTPEGEIRVKNTGAEPVADLSLTIVFYDNTRRKRTGAVTIAAASAKHPLPSGQIRSLYFSSPNIMKAENQLCVLILWKGRLLTQLPVVKER